MNNYIINNISPVIKIDKIIMDSTTIDCENECEQYNRR